MTTRAGCGNCRLRFVPSAAAFPIACPECGEPTQAFTLEGMVGFRSLRLEDVAQPLPEAVAVALPVPERGGAPTNAN